MSLNLQRNKCVFVAERSRSKWQRKNEDDDGDGDGCDGDPLPFLVPLSLFVVAPILVMFVVRTDVARARVTGGGLC